MKLDLNNLTYFHAKNTDQGMVVHGQTSCLLGHRIETQNNSPDGVFVEWQWKDNEFSLHTDKYGFYPVFYYQSQDELIISTSIVKILELGAPKELNYTGLSIFLRLGFYLREDTPFQHIHALPPNAKLTWSKNQFDCTGSLIIEKQLHISRSEAMDGYISLFKDAMKARRPINEDFVVPISGGRDSRHILLDLIQSGHRPKFCITHEQYQLSGSYKEDIIIASKLMAELQLKHIIIQQKQSRYKAEKEKNLITSYLSNENQQILVMADYLQNKTETIYDGIAGDVLTEYKLIVPEHVEMFREGKIKELAKTLLNFWEGEETIIKPFLTKEFYKQVNYDLSLNYLMDELKRHQHAPNPLSSFYFWNRTRREISLISFTILGHIQNVYCPYLDHQLCQFLSSLSFDIIADATFHTETILKAYPEHAHIPFQPYRSKHMNMAEDINRFNKEFAIDYFKKIKFSSPLINSKFMLPRLFKTIISYKYLKECQWFPCIRLLCLSQIDDQIT